MEWSRPGDPPAPRVLILGGGFAGVYTAFELRKRLGRARAQIDIVNRENFFVFYPMIPEIVSGAIETDDILNPIRLVAPRTTLYVGEVTRIDLAAQTVDILHGLYRHRQRERTLAYDHVVLALGGIPNTSRIPGLGEYAFDVQRLAHAFALRNHLVDVLEQGDIETHPVDKQRILTVVVVGGGANGVEVVAQIRDLMVDAAAHYPHLEPDDFRIVLVHGGDRLLPDLPASLARYAERLLRDRGVEILLNRRVTRVEPTAVHLDDGTTIETETIVGSVGVQPNPLVRDLPLSHDERGQIRVDDYLSTREFPNVWAVGDNALVIDPYTHRPYPQTAQHAIREARVVAHNIAARLQGESLEPIAYRTRGQMVALGHRSAAVDAFGMTFSGFVAWWLWRTYYLAQLPRWEKRLRVTFDWTLDLLFPPTLVQLKVGQTGPRTGAEEATGAAPADVDTGRQGGSRG
ncbi:MAG TPA: NAD(P)/FAD-dependent oxidoreductase [Thermomicrobiaceae bacterium]|nr:NAD(P)/FAD-dependent oxidoreductase [Thermomicrobiaceae bacterium]